MNLSRVTVIGGGPAGLFAAALVRRRWPDAVVVVHERAVPDETFGFGVAFTRRTLEVLATADADTVAGIEAASIPMPRQEIRVAGRSAFSGGNTGGITIARSALLKTLLDGAQRAGVEVRLGSEVTLDQVDPGADLVIAADGVGSATRQALGDEIGAAVVPARGLFMWLGCDRRLDSNLFAPMATEHGLFNIHGYPYSADRSTIGVEADELTWRRAGMDIWTDETPEGASDERSIAALQKVFASTLGEARLLGNRSRWMRFRTVSTAHWSRGSVVLLGDAAHTAHYSVGSGTKMAMEDAVALVDALSSASADSIPAALRIYEHARRPRVEVLQRLADRSRWWWETLGERLDLGPERLMLAYLSRGGAVSADRLIDHEPELLRVGVQEWAPKLDPTALAAAARLSAAVLATPFDDPDYPHPTRVLDIGSDTRVHVVHGDLRDPWGAEASALAAGLAGVESNADVVLLAGVGRRDDLLDRLQLAEHVRQRTPLPVAVQADPMFTNLVVDGLIAGRLDLVSFTAGTL